MAQVLTTAIGGLLIVLGFIGCVVPVLPGPLLAFCALLVPFAFGCGVPLTTLLVCGGVVAVVTVVDYLLPAFCARKFKCSGSGIVGCVLGSIAGLFFMPLGLVVCPFVGTVLGELTAGRNMAEAARGGVGALLGFVCSVIAKIVAVGFVACAFFASLGKAAA